MVTNLNRPTKAFQRAFAKVVPRDAREKAASAGWTHAGHDARVVLNNVSHCPLGVINFLTHQIIPDVKWEPCTSGNGYGSSFHNLAIKAKRDAMLTVDEWSALYSGLEKFVDMADGGSTHKPELIKEWFIGLSLEEEAELDAPKTVAELAEMIEVERVTARQLKVARVVEVPVTVHGQ